MSKFTSYLQTDQRWKNKQLGTSNTNISGYGCTITSLCNFLNGHGYSETPATVNDKLVANDGYSNGNLLRWWVIDDVWNKVTGYNRVRDNYNNTEVKQAINDYGACLVEVLHPSGFIHWVLYIGGKKMVDPLSGIEPTSKYPAIGYCVIKTKETMPNDEIIGKSSQRDKVVDEFKFNIGTAKDDELLNALNDYIDDNYIEEEECVDKSKVENMIQNAKQDTQEKYKDKLSEQAEQCKKEKYQILGEISELLDGYEGEIKLSSIKNSISQREAERKKLKERMAKEKKDPVQYSLSETAKELLRWVVIGLIPVTLTYLGGLKAEWAVSATLVIRLIDKAIHKYGKETGQDFLTKGLTRF